MRRLFTKSALMLFVLSAIATPLHAEGWLWNPAKSFSQPNWLTRSFTSTTHAVKSTTASTWSAMSRGTSAAWHKTAEILDPYPNKIDKVNKPATANEFLSQERMEF